MPSCDAPGIGRQAQGLAAVTGTQWPRLRRAAGVVPVGRGVRGAQVCGAAAVLWDAGMEAAYAIL